jgi:CRP-like cAMP-binding protein
MSDRDDARPDEEDDVQVDARHLLALRRFPGFARHEAGDLSLMLQVFKEELLPRGTVLYKHGQLTKSVYFVLQGKVTITHEGHAHEVEHGPLGVLEMLSGKPQSGAVAATDVLALVASFPELLDVIGESFTLLANGLRSMGAEIARELALVPPESWPITKPPLPLRTPAPALGLVEKLLEVRRFPRWAGIRVEALAELARSSEEVTHPAGTVLWRQGERSGDIFLILAGTVDAVRPSGRFPLRAGDETGLVETLAVLPRWYDAVVTEPLHALRLSHDALLDVIEDQVDLGIALLRSLAADLVDLDNAPDQPRVPG